MKTISVTIIKQRDDGSLFKISLDKEDALKWQTAVEGQAVVEYTHGRKFPELSWKAEELTINDSIY